MENNKLEKSLSLKRFILSLIILLIALFLLLFTLHCFDNDNWETAFTAIIGLSGTWVGAVIAFYFSKDNFDAASASTQKLVDSITTSKEKLSTTQANIAMIKLSDMTYLTIEKVKKLTDHKLTEILGKYLTKKNRLPILYEDGSIYGIVHKSLIVEFITNQAIDGNLPDSLSLDNLIKVNKFKDQIEKGFSTVKENDSLISVKLLMEKMSIYPTICSDVFVTFDGKRNSKVIGWITNVEISKHSII